ncbi:MAG TPA: TauD/TfdA family dioxygenase [Pseudomonadales bacterium]|nr:TauD/TfdA family dioxygenase [Pseudomonadales bacterium]
MQVEKLSAPLGAVVTNIDVNEVTDASWPEINDLFCKYHVLVFPDQKLTPETQMAFAARWGKLIRHPYAGMKDYPDIIELSNQGKQRDVNQHWHSDMTYNPVPPKLTMLYALKAPDIGGDTAFSNQVLAYEELSDGLKSVIDGLGAEHSAAGLAQIYKEDSSEAPRATHPVVRTHDETGERALYVCRAFTRKFVGWTRAESKPLLEFLFEQGTRPEYQARHRWRAGDLAMWDNRCLLHYAVHDHGDDERVIHRVQIEGSVPE